MNGKRGIKTLALILAILASGVVYSENAGISEMLEKAQNAFDEKSAFPLIDEVNKNGGSNRELCLGIIYHNLSRKNPDKYLKKALTLLKNYYEKTTNALCYGYYGSAVTIEASSIYKKTSVITNTGGQIITNRDLLGASLKLDEGCGIIDRALTSDPDNISLRFLRLNNSISVSRESPFKRYDIADGDCQYLFEHFYKNAKESPGDRYWKSQLQLLSGEAAIGEGKLEEALSHFEKVLEILPGSPAAEEAKKYINEYEE